jgi:hypothetical protein
VTPLQVPGEVIARFGFAGTVQVARFGTGLINESYRVVGPGPEGVGSYLLQRLNPQVFPNGDAVMANISAVTAHLGRAVARDRGADRRRMVLELIPAPDGAPAFVGPDGARWRLFRFIEGAVTHDRVTQPREAFEVARAFGRFHALLANYDGPPLATTIPGFHDTPARLAALERAVERDSAGRAGSLTDEIAIVRARAPMAGWLEAAAREGRVPLGLAHHDAKASNVLIDAVTGEGLAVVDLDTVMPGLRLYDVGDLIRSVTCSTAEDATDPRAATARGDLFRALADGFVEGLRPVRLAPEECELFVASGLVITYEQGLRFLTDYLEGDRYYRTVRPGQNLDRARVQFTLLRSLEQQRREFEAMVRDAAG